MAVILAALTLGCADTSNHISPFDLVPSFDLAEVPCPPSQYLGESTTPVTCYSLGEAVWDLLADLQDHLDAEASYECNESLNALIANAANLFLFDGHSDELYRRSAPLGGTWAVFQLSEYHFDEGGMLTLDGVHTLFHEGLHLAEYDHDHPDFGGTEEDFDAFAGACIADHEFEGPGPGHPDPV